MLFILINCNEDEKQSWCKSSSFHSNGWHQFTLKLKICCKDSNIQLISFKMNNFGSVRLILVPVTYFCTYKILSYDFFIFSLSFHVKYNCTAMLYLTLAGT